jgi:hypothetical protein
MTDRPSGRTIAEAIQAVASSLPRRHAPRNDRTWLPSSLRAVRRTARQSPTLRRPKLRKLWAHYAKQTQFATSGYIRGDSGFEGGRYEIRDTRYAQIVWTECQTKPIRCVFELIMEVVLKTKPIGAAGTAAIEDWRLGIGDSLGWPKWPCGRNAKQTQFATFGYIAGGIGRADGWRFGIRGWQMRDTRYEIRDTRRPCGQNVKQSQFPAFLAQE